MRIAVFLGWSLAFYGYSTCVFAQADLVLSPMPMQSKKMQQGDGANSVSEGSAALSSALPEQTTERKAPPPLGVGTGFLQRLAGIALQRSPQVHDAEAGWRAARMDVEDARGGRWPRVDVTGNSKSKMFGTGNPYGNGSDSSVSLTASYTLYDGGRIARQISAREYQEQSARAKYLQQREQTVLDTATAYLQIVKYRHLVDLHQQNISRLELLAAKMNEIVQVLSGRRSEMTQVTARLLQAKDSKATAEKMLREYEIQLVKLVGPENLPNHNSNGTNIEAIPPNIGLAAAKKNHPMLLAAEAERLALIATTEAARAENYRPTFELRATKTSGVDTMGYSNPGQVFVAFKWNAFQGFSGRAQEKALLERASAAEERYRQTMSEIEYSLNSAWADYGNQVERIESMKELAVSTEQVRSDYFVQWEALGRRSLLEVLTAENEHLSTMVNLITSEADKNLAAAKLRFESGLLCAWVFSEAH